MAVKYTCPLCGAAMFLEAALPSLVCPKCNVPMVDKGRVDCGPMTGDAAAPPVFVSPNGRGCLKVARPLTAGMPPEASAMETREAGFLAWNCAGKTASVPDLSENLRIGRESSGNWYVPPSEILDEARWRADEMEPGIGKIPGIGGCRVERPEENCGSETVALEYRPLTGEDREDIRNDYDACSRQLAAASEECGRLERELKVAREELERQKCVWRLEADRGRIQAFARQAKKYFFRLNLIVLICCYSLLIALETSGWKNGVSWGFVLFFSCYFLAVFRGLVCCTRDMSVLASEVRRVQSESAGATDSSHLC